MKSKQNKSDDKITMTGKQDAINILNNLSQTDILRNFFLIQSEFYQKNFLNCHKQSCSADAFFKKHNN